MKWDNYIQSSLKELFEDCKTRTEFKQRVMYWIPLDDNQEATHKKRA